MKDPRLKKRKVKRKPLKANKLKKELLRGIIPINRQLGGASGVNNIFQILSQLSQLSQGNQDTIDPAGDVNGIQSSFNIENILGQISTGLTDNGFNEGIGGLLSSILSPSTNSVDTSGVLTNSQGFLGFRKLGGKNTNMKKKKRKKRFRFQAGGRVVNIDDAIDDKDSKKGKKKLRRYLKKQEKQINEIREQIVEDTYDTRLEQSKQIFNAQYGDTGLSAEAITPRSGLQLFKKGGKVKKKKKGKKYQLGGSGLLGSNQIPQQTAVAPDAIGLNNSAGNFLMPGVPQTFSPLLPSGSQLQALAQQEQLNQILQSIGETPVAQLGGLSAGIEPEITESVEELQSELAGIPVDPNGLLTNNGPVIIPSRDITFKPAGLPLDEVTIVTPIPGVDAVVETPIAAISINREEDRESRSKGSRRRRKPNNRKKRKKRLADIHQPINDGRKC